MPLTVASGLSVAAHKCDGGEADAQAGELEQHDQGFRRTTGLVGEANVAVQRERGGAALKLLWMSS